MGGEARGARQLNSAELLDALASRHSRDTFVPECKMGESGSRRLDAWAASKSWSPWTTFGYEIKVSRADFLGDRKWESYLPVCHEFSFVCPRGLIQAEELPEGVGLLWNHGRHRLTTRRKALRRVPDPETLLRLVAYVIMSRVQIVSNMWEANDSSAPDPRDRWGAWLLEEDGKRWVGHMVGRRLAERLKNEMDLRRNAERESERLNDVRELIRSWGLDPASCGRYDLERRFGNGATALRRLGAQARRMAEDAENLATALESPK